MHYCNKFTLKTKSKIDFNNTLKDIGINHKPSNCQNVYKVTYDELIKISDKFHWVHELDEYRNNNDDDEDDENNNDETGARQHLDKSVDVNLLFNQKIEILEDENDNMKRYIKQLEKIVNELDKKIN